MSAAHLAAEGDSGHAALHWPRRIGTRPVRIALLGDFGANAAAGRLETGISLARRGAHRVERDTLDRTLSRICPGITLPLGADASPVYIGLPRLQAFDADSLLRDVDVFRAIATLRRRLSNSLGFGHAAEEIHGWSLDTSAPIQAARQGHARGGHLHADLAPEDFARLVGRPTATGRPVAPEALMRRMAGRFVRASATQDQAGLIAGLDCATADILGAVLHQPDMQLAEALWRGVDYLLQRLPADGSVQLDLIDISAQEFAADLGDPSALDGSGLHRVLVDQHAGDMDAGYRYVAACYRFEPTAAQIALLGRAASIGAEGGATFITAIEPAAFLDVDAAPADALQAALATLRASPEAGSLALIAPHFLLRQPYGAPTSAAGALRYEEFAGADELDHLLWGHPSLLALCSLLGPAPEAASAESPTLPATPAAPLRSKRQPVPTTDVVLQADDATRLGLQGINAVVPTAEAPGFSLGSLHTFAGAPLAPPA